MAADFMRIGDVERDEAVGMLREHHANGRLSAEEFDDRMSRALGARTRSDLDALFPDLPMPRPGQGYSGSTATPQPVVPPEYGYDTPTPSYGYDAPPVYGYGQHLAPYQQPQTPVPHQKPPRPWWAQWWMIFAGLGLAAALDFGFLLPMMALWLWVIYPSVFENRRPKEVGPPPEPTRPLTYSEREYVMDEVRAGRKINAIKRYRELTGAGLRDAKVTVDLWSRQIGR